jgi:hypothetical protein
MRATRSIRTLSSVARTHLRIMRTLISITRTLISVTRTLSSILRTLSSITCTVATLSTPQAAAPSEACRTTRGAEHAARTRRPQISAHWPKCRRGVRWCSAYTWHRGNGPCGSPLATSAPGPGSPLPHLHRDWARPCHICTGTGAWATRISLRCVRGCPAEADRMRMQEAEHAISAPSSARSLPVAVPLACLC